MEDFVNFEVAKKLKEKGFREKCFGYYSYWGDEVYYYIIQDPVPSRQLTFKDFKGCKNVYEEIEKYDAPTISQVLKWLRDVHHLNIEIISTCCGYHIMITKTPDVPNEGGNELYCSFNLDDGPNNAGAWDDYKDCSIIGIEYVLDNLINGNEMLQNGLSSLNLINNMIHLNARNLPNNGKILYIRNNFFLCIRIKITPPITKIANSKIIFFCCITSTNKSDRIIHFYKFFKSTTTNEFTNVSKFINRKKHCVIHYIHNFISLILMVILYNNKKI